MTISFLLSVPGRLKNRICKCLSVVQLVRTGEDVFVEKKTEKSIHALEHTGME